MAPRLLYQSQTVSDPAAEWFLGDPGKMNLTIWIPLTFGLGIVSIIVCYAFLKACEKI
jgi:hypothetical protein